MKPTNNTSIITKNGESINRKMTPSLLDSKRSLAVNIFLKQFKFPITKIVDRIHRCDGSFFTTEHLHCMQKILPDKFMNKMLLYEFSMEMSLLFFK